MLTGEGAVAAIEGVGGGGLSTTALSITVSPISRIGFIQNYGSITWAVTLWRNEGRDLSYRKDFCTKGTHYNLQEL